MLSHRGKGRSFGQNLRLAVLLSFVGGIVNVCGFLALKLMTTNVTGYLSNFAQEFLSFNRTAILKSVLLLVSFFLGSFISHVILQVQKLLWNKVYFTVPLILEAILLGGVAYLEGDILSQYPMKIAYVLLFAMGLQNSLVTFISKAVVRTTHITGIVTDLGIETARLIFYSKNTAVRRVLFSHIGLKVAIVFSFGLGGIIAAYCFQYLHLRTLYIGMGVILLTTVYDFLMVKMILVLEEGRHLVDWSKRAVMKDHRLHRILRRRR
ncbi:MULTISPECIES: YoaK family protein [Myroides]|uniref:DUF1275 domain-containing protein n=1 Tax=Myroides albus TaxID=2562892 RepID=A0A6I3LQI4_9FLAO|nr:MULTISPECIES: YoaK family protein [Myroides]MTG98402.1 DUF1275 domain-containing protein [Myroides albus]MVX36795.1 DUF1275 domain-containing protein [Myroides sp. LoEW2-1]UVD79687.1 DUF1275 domain-containing protein [Myroides albus]